MKKGYFIKIEEEIMNKIKKLAIDKGISSSKLIEDLIKKELER